MEPLPQERLQPERRDGPEAVLCPICEADHAAFWGLEFKGHTIVKCRECGLRYVSPRRTSEENTGIYDDEKYFAAMPGDHRHLERFEYFLRTNLKTLRRILAYSSAADPRILDVGTGTGFLLLLAKMMGFHRVAGTDLTDVNRPLLSEFGIPLLVGDIVDMPPGAGGAPPEFAPGGFDVITLLHVLEHVMEPNAFLARVRDLLAPEGLLYLIVPNEGNLPSMGKSFISRIKLKKRAFKHLSPGHHLFFYTRSTLPRLLAKNGFTVLYSGTRSGEKNRGLLNRALHRLIDRSHQGTWIEIVARKSG